jgi:hypothetical protein
VAPAASANQGELAGVSCTGSSACTAAGNYTNGVGNPVPLVERWDGTSWTVQAGPEAGGEGGLAGVACSSATYCVAVGNRIVYDHLTVPFAETWSAGAWVTHSVATQHNETGLGDIELYGVACPSRQACFAVGSFDDQLAPTEALLDRWNGVKWSVQAPEHTDGTLAGVSCSSPRSCTAVGQDNHNRTLIERWNGSSWTRQPSPNVPGGKADELDAVSCPSSNACTAVGGYYTNEGFTLGGILIEQWNGIAWTIVSSLREPAWRYFAVELLGVSCSSARACTAVGSASGNDPSLGVIDRLSGGHWTLQPHPRVAGTALDAVSCASPLVCTAVGASNAGPLVEASS